MELSCSFSHSVDVSHLNSPIYLDRMSFNLVSCTTRGKNCIMKLCNFYWRAPWHRILYILLSRSSIFSHIFFISLKIIFVQTTMFCAFDKRQYWILQANVSKLTILNVLGCWKSLLSIRYYCFLCIRANIKNGKNQKCSAVLVIVVVVVVVFVVVVDAIHIDCCFNSSLSCVCLLFSILSFTPSLVSVLG